MAIDSNLMLDNVLEYLRELMKTSDKEKLSVETLQIIKRLRKDIRKKRSFLSIRVLMLKGGWIRYEISGYACRKEH